ncbi:SAM-dependent methyltransferase, partial [Mycobacterium kansasii]
MAMNLIHRRRCSSPSWERAVADQLLPWALHGVELGARTVEI